MRSYKVGGVMRGFRYGKVKREYYKWVSRSYKEEENSKVGWGS